MDIIELITEYKSPYVAHAIKNALDALYDRPCNDPKENLRDATYHLVQALKFMDNEK